MNFDPDKINYKELGFFRYRKLDDKYLLTTESGNYTFLNQDDFKKFVEGGLSGDKKEELFKKNFIPNEENVDEDIKRYRKKKNFLFQGPSLHIIETTLRCNQNCVYCQASAKGEEEKSSDMDIETAKKVVDFIFETPNEKISIEFQGGEPLLNWEVVKFITEYAREKNKTAGKDLELRLVSNFCFMNEERMSFFFDNNVSVCTSLDGPEDLHNKNRPYPKGNSYEDATKWFKKAMKKHEKENSYHQPGVITTVTKNSLDKPKEIVDEYKKLGLEVIFLRPVNPLGMAQKTWKEVGYKPEEYLDFYEKALDYILDLNRKGEEIYETMATIMATKVLTDDDPNYLELCSPCGAGLGQLAYSYDGNIYTCDEGRMLRQMDEGDAFKLGNVKDSYTDIMESSTLKTTCLASEVTSLPQCSQCAYAPYCGVCPIYNYVMQGNIFGQLKNNDRCKTNMGLFDMIFKKIQDPKNKKVLERWAEKEIEMKEGEGGV